MQHRCGSTGRWGRLSPVPGPLPWHIPATFSMICVLRPLAPRLSCSSTAAPPTPTPILAPRYVPPELQPTALLSTDTTSEHCDLHHQTVMALHAIAALLKAQYTDLQEQYFILRQSLAPLNLTRWQIFRLLLAQAWRDTPDAVKIGLASLIGVLLLVAVDTWIIQPYFLSVRRLGVPQLKPGRGKHAWDYKPMLDEAVEKYPHSPWFFSYSGFEFVVFPSAYVDEIRRLPARTASLVNFLTTVQFGGWRLIGTDDTSSTLHKVASTDLARSIAPMGLARQETAQRAWRKALDGKQGPRGGQWNTVSLIWTVLDVVARTGATGLVGAPLSNDARWLAAVKILPVTVGIGVVASSYFPRLLRPLVANISYLPAFFVHRWMSFLVRPTVEKAISEFQNTETAKDQKKPTFVHLLIQRYNSSELNIDQVVRDVITASFESTPTTAASLYWMLTELLIRPELVEELREEVASVIDKEGKLPQSQLTELPKLDSFMRESARVNTFHYRTLHPRSFSVRFLLVPASALW